MRYPWDGLLSQLAGNYRGFDTQDTRTPDDIEHDRYMARMTLMNITSQDFKYDVAQWGSWIESHLEIWFGGRLTSDEIYAAFPELQSTNAVEEVKGLDTIA